MLYDSLKIFFCGLACLYFFYDACFALVFVETSRRSVVCSSVCRLSVDVTGRRE